MPKKSSVLVPLSGKSFASETDGLPEAAVEQKYRTAASAGLSAPGRDGIELLSRKQVPAVIPDTADAQVRMTCSVSYEEGARFGFILCFRYDTLVGRGQYVRLTGSDKEKTVTFEYGTTRLNHFTPVQTKTMPADTALMAKPMTVTLEIRGRSSKVRILEQKAVFG